MTPAPLAGGAPGLHLEEIRIAFADGPERLVALDGATLSVAPGELVAVAGRSGSGKSTLLAVAGLLRRPDSGEVTVDGRPTATLGERSRTALRRDRIGIVHQSAQLFPSLTALQQLELVAHIRGEPRGPARRRAAALLDEVGLGDRTGHLPAQLSGGERQRVELARALMAEPSVLLADEPTAALDAARAGEMVELIATETRRRGLAAVLVTHDADHLGTADRVFELRDGLLRAVPEPAAT